MNHGCNGTYNTGVNSDVTEFTADIVRIPESLNWRTRVFNPVVDRNLRHFTSGADVAMRSIKAGEEILDNYLAFVGTDDDWEYDVKSLREQCSGAVGEVGLYEES